MKMNNKFLFGVIVIFVGILLLLEQASIFPEFSRMIWSGIWKFWPLILIFLGAKFLSERNNVPGIILLLLGVAFLSSNLFSWNFFAVLWPIILIAIGMSILLGTGETKKKPEASTSSKEFLSDTVVFWGLDRKIKSQDFKGGEFNVAFGGLQLDLRDAKIAKGGAKVHINCAFGGVEVFVPKDCRVKTKGSGVFGAWEPKVEDRKVDTPVLEITGGVMFGGVEIK
jgi:predicted membrane protein